MQRTQVRPHHQHILDQWAEGPAGPDQLLGREGGDHRLHQGVGARKTRAGVTVNAICPGYINTDMVKAMSKEVLEKSVLPLIPIGRLGEPEEVARCVLFLASDDAGLITGSTLSANGGQIMVRRADQDQQSGNSQATALVRLWSLGQAIQFQLPRRLMRVIFRCIRLSGRLMKDSRSMSQRNRPRSIRQGRVLSEKEEHVLTRAGNAFRFQWRHLRLRSKLQAPRSFHAPAETTCGPFIS